MQFLLRKCAFVLILSVLLEVSRCEHIPAEEAALPAAGVNVAMLEDGPERPTSLDGTPVVPGSPADWWFEGGITGQPEFTVDGGVFEDHIRLSMFSGTLEAIIIYTTADADDADNIEEPGLDWKGVTGTMYDGAPLLFSRSTVIRAISVHMDAMDSEVVESVFTIKNTAPVFSIIQGTFADAVAVTISANSSEPSAPPYITVTFDGTDPHPNDQLGIGAVIVQVRKTGVLKAIAWQDGLIPSEISFSGVLEVMVPEVPAQTLWRGSVAWWSLGDTKYHYGRYARARVRWGGACDEQHPSEIYPARIAGRDGMLGAVLTGPGCKGGMWDVDPGGISDCDIHPLRFNGTLGTSGYHGRIQTAVRGGGASCVVSRQPNLETFSVVHKGVAALRFDGAVNRGLLVAQGIDSLVLEHRLPTSAFSLEVQMTITSATVAGRHLRALAAAQQDSAGFVGEGNTYSKGWSLLYETDFVKQTVTLRFAVSLESNNDRNNHGRFRTLKHSIGMSHFAEEQWTHLVAVYDLHTLALYVNGTLGASEAACDDHILGCGDIVYPMATDPQAREATPLTLGMYENVQTGLSVSHVGHLAEVRIFREVLPAHVIVVASERLLQRNPEGHCQEGSYGAYEGLVPCQACAAGSYTDLPRRDVCEACPRGTWQDESGRSLCFSCPVFLTTATLGAQTEDKCEEPDMCAAWSGLRNPCHPNATCAKVPGSYTCTCNTGYLGDGTLCAPKCGDARVMPSESCDDGNNLDSDGCSAICSMEEGFTCPTPAAPMQPSVCECKLDGEVCCARDYVNCLLQASRFTPDGYGQSSAGLLADGCTARLQGNISWHLAQPAQSCEAACSALPSADSPEGGELECVGHSTFEAQLAFVQGVSLPAAMAFLYSSTSRDVWTCARVVTSRSNSGLAHALLPQTLPMIDQFSVTGTRAGGSGTPDGQLICYVYDDTLETISAEKTEWCNMEASVKTGRRLCQCQPKPNRCSRDCLTRQALCNAKVASRALRLQEAYETHNPCYDNPDYSGTFYDAHTQVNLTFDNCSAVGDFLYRSIPANTSSGEPIPYNERLGVSNSNVSNMTLVERFRRSTKDTHCGCGGCAVTCGSCDRCYQEGGTWWYGAHEAPHPNRPKHPSILHGVDAALMSYKCAASDVNCQEAGCNKALAYCGKHGLNACLDDQVCWKQPLHSNACAEAFSEHLPLDFGRPRTLPRPAGESVKEGETSCECMGWYHNCLLVGGAPARLQ
mmetsp:Transcript_63665/g.102966  ORF Transcript_63665/g.102966 Transcript_63665/m.102966 type:complete len:1236 (+) Transcript_63665:90-3797(+)